MNIFEAEKYINELIKQNKSIDEILDELACKKYNHVLVEMVLLKKKIGNEEDVKLKIRSHNYYSKYYDDVNPFTEEFIKMIKNNRK